MFAAMINKTPITMNITIMTPICMAADLSSFSTIDLPPCKESADISVGCLAQH